MAKKKHEPMANRKMSAPMGRGNAPPIIIGIGGRTLRNIRYKSQGQLSQPMIDAAENYLLGMSKKASLIDAGYSEQTAIKAPQTVFDRADVVDYIHGRRLEMNNVKDDDSMETRIKDELARIAFFNIGHFLRINEDGTFIYDFSEATMKQLAAVGSAEVETYFEGKGRDRMEVQRIKFKPYDKQTALVALARIQGMFNDSLEVKGEISLADRIQAGRKRSAIDNPKTIDGEFEEIE